MLLQEYGLYDCKVKLLKCYRLRGDLENIDSEKEGIEKEESHNNSQKIE